MNTIIRFSAFIETMSMLHIGASGFQSKGRFDKAYIKNCGEPVLPGSSFRGVVRHKMVELTGGGQNAQVAGLNVHLCKNAPACDVCMAFGVPAQNLMKKNSGQLTACHSMALIGKNDQDQQEAKKRDIEVVPAGAQFVISWQYELYEAADVKRVGLILAAMNAVQETDSIGAMGQAGHGKIALLDVSAELITDEVIFQRAEPQQILAHASIAEVVS